MINLAEFVYTISHPNLVLAEKKRLHTANASSRSNVLGPFARPPANSPLTMKVQQKDKPLMLGNCIVQCGGRSTGTSVLLRTPHHALRSGSP